MSVMLDECYDGECRLEYVEWIGVSIDEYLPVVSLVSH